MKIKDTFEENKNKNQSLYMHILDNDLFVDENFSKNEVLYNVYIVNSFLASVMCYGLSGYYNVAIENEKEHLEKSLQTINANKMLLIVKEANKVVLSAQERIKEKLFGNIDKLNEKEQKLLQTMTDKLYDNNLDVDCEKALCEYITKNQDKDI